MRRHALPILALFAASLAAPPAAWAHAFLASASPAAGSHLAAVPPDLTLRFTEGVEPRFSSIVLSGPAGPVALPDPTRADGDRKRLSVTLPPLPPGAYTVIWHAASVDTHKTEGKFQFTIGP